MEVGDAGYPLRPEIVESTYYLHQFTRDPMYLRMGESMFDDFVRHCKTDVAYASLKSVVTKEKADSMESFLFAETFKYFYLLFAPPSALPFERSSLIPRRTPSGGRGAKRKESESDPNKKRLLSLV